MRISNGSSSYAWMPVYHTTVEELSNSGDLLPWRLLGGVSMCNGFHKLIVDGMAAVVNTRGFISMCGGYLVGIDATVKPSINRGEHLTTGDLSGDTLRYMRRRQAGICQVYLKTNTKKQASFWVPLVNLAIEKLNQQYAVGHERLSVAYGKTIKANARTVKHHWIIHKFSQYGFNLCSSDTPEDYEIKCPWCGGNDLCIDPSYTSLIRCGCGFVSYGSHEFNDDTGLTGDKGYDYANDVRWAAAEHFYPTFSQIRYGEAVDQFTVYNLSFYSGNEHPINLTNLVRVLASKLPKWQYLRLSSNVGAARGTQRAIVMLYNNMHLLAEWGLELITPGEYACNPREHFHYTDSCILNVVNPTKLAEFLATTPYPRPLQQTHSDWEY